MMNKYWCALTNRMAVEAIAEYLNLELEELEPPDPAEPAQLTAPLAYLVDTLRELLGADEATAYVARNAFRIARHLQRFEEIGHQCEQADLDDLEALLGTRPRAWREGEEALERFVLADEGRHDTELVRLFYRRTQRAQMVLGPAGSAMVKHHRTQPFRPVPAGRG
jgi:hypothetical protein